MAATKSTSNTAPKRGLGRGLSALIPDDDMEFLSQVARGTAPPAPVSAEAGGAASRGGGNSGAGSREEPAQRRATADASPFDMVATSTAVPASPTALTQWIDISSIEANPYQPRRHFSQHELDELAASIRTHGVLQPILVRPTVARSDNPTGAVGQRYQMVAGERRWRAAQMAGLSQVPAIVREVADQQALELALIENVQRHDISAMDAALAYRRLAVEFKLSQEHIARRVGKSRSAVANTMRLLDLPPEARKAIEDGVITEGHGRAILLASGEGARRAVFRRLVRDRLSVREAERLAQRAVPGALSRGDFATERAGSAKDVGTESSNDRLESADLQQIAARLQKALGARLSIKPRGEGGVVLIRYSSGDELQRIVSLFDTLSPPHERR